MDKTKSQGQDNDQEEQTSGTGNGTTSEEATYTKEQVDKIRSDTLAAAGRERVKVEKALEDANKQLERLDEERKVEEEELERLKQERDEAEASHVDGKPDALSALQQRQKLRAAAAELTKREREIQRREADLNEGLKTIQRMKLQSDAESLALEYGVSSKTLLELTDGSREKMEALAKVLPRDRKDLPDSTNITKPDSGVTTGTRGKLTKEQAHKLPMDQYAQAVKDGRI